MKKDNDEKIIAAVATIDRGLPRSYAAPVGMVLFALLTAVGAHIKIPLPFTPVPATLQVFFVLLCGLLMGPYYGTASLALYLGMGFAGLPMFTTPSAGFAPLLGPTGGYLLGFVIAQPVIAAISSISRDQIGTPSHLLRIAASMAAGIAVIYLAGMIHLSALTGMGITRAFYAGVLPFILSDVAKACVAAVAAIAITRRFGPVAKGE